MSRTLHSSGLANMVEVVCTRIALLVTFVLKSKLCLFVACIPDRHLCCPTRHLCSQEQTVCLFVACISRLSPLLPSSSPLASFAYPCHLCSCAHCAINFTRTALTKPLQTQFATFFTKDWDFWDNLTNHIYCGFVRGFGCFEVIMMDYNVLKVCLG